MQYHEVIRDHDGKPWSLEDVVVYYLCVPVIYECHFQSEENDAIVEAFVSQMSSMGE